MTHPPRHDDGTDDLADVRTPMSQLVAHGRRWLAAVVAAAMLLPAGAWAINELRFRSSSDAVVETLEGGLSGQGVADTVLLVRAVRCAGGQHGSGSAFVVATDAGPVLVTNRHVVEGFRAVGVRSLTGSAAVRVTGVRVSDQADVAVLEVDDPGSLPPALAARAGRVTEGEDVRLVGFPAAMPFTTEGTVAQVGPDRLLLDLQVDRGASGSPVVDDDGHVVGQVFAVASDGKGVATPTATMLAAVTEARTLPPC